MNRCENHANGSAKNGDGAELLLMDIVEFWIWIRRNSPLADKSLGGSIIISSVSQYHRFASVSLPNLLMCILFIFSVFSCPTQEEKIIKMRLNSPHFCLLPVAPATYFLLVHFIVWAKAFHYHYFNIFTFSQFNRRKSSFPSTISTSCQFLNSFIFRGAMKWYLFAMKRK